MQLLAPLLLIANKKWGVDLGPTTDAFLLLSFTVYNVASNLKSASIAKSQATVAVAEVHAAAPTAATATSVTTVTEAKP
jgi:hypothetical protein